MALNASAFSRPASGTVAGLLTGAAQTVAGLKTFSGGIIASGVPAATPGSLTAGVRAAVGSYNNNLGAAALWLGNVAPDPNNYTIAASTSAGLGVAAGTSINGTGGQPISMRMGGSQVSRVETDGTYIASISGNEIGFGKYVYSRAAGFLFDTAGGLLFLGNNIGSAYLGISIANGLASCTGAFQSNAGTFQSGANTQLLLKGQGLGGSSGQQAVKAGTTVANASLHIDGRVLAVAAGLGGTETEIAFITKDRIEHTAVGGGLVLASPNGTRYRLTINNAGAVVVAAA